MIPNLSPEEKLNLSIESLGAAIDRSNAEKDMLRERLKLITRAALERIDGDSQPNDTHWTEIVGIAEGDPNWLQHAIANYEVKHAQIVQFCARLLESINEQYEGGDSNQRIAEYMADQIEQDLLPVQFLAEDGRVFLRSQGKPYPRVEAGK